MPVVVQPSFISGELTPSLHGRVDLARYYTALRTCRNFIVRPYGGVTNRAGTRFVSEVADSSQLTRLIPFQFSSSQTYVLEFGHHTMRVFRNGGIISNMDPEEKAITGVVSGTMRGAIVLSRVKVTCPAHGFTNVDVITISGVEGAPEANGTWEISVIDPDNYELVYPVPHVGSYFTITGAYTGGGAAHTQTGTVSVPTPWASSDLALLKYIQSADVLTVCHPEFPPHQVSRLSDASWRVKPFVPLNGPFLDLNIDNAKTMCVSDLTDDIEITANFNVFEAQHVGLLIRLDQTPDNWTPKWEVNKVVAAGSVVRSGSHYYMTELGGTTGAVPPGNIEGTERDGNSGVLWRYIHSGYGIAQITGFTDAKHVAAIVLRRFPESLVTSTDYAVPYVKTAGIGDAYQRTYAAGFVPAVGSVITLSGSTDATLNGTFSVHAVGADGNGQYFSILNSQKSNTGTFGGAIIPTPGLVVQQGSASQSYKWAFQAWGAGSKYPRATMYYQQRQVFGGTATKPHGVWMSASGGFTEFGQSVPMLDDDAIKFDLVAENMNEVRHFLRMKDLIVLTSECAWVISKQQGSPIPDVNPHDAGGSSHIPPLKIGKKAIYVEEKGGAVRSLGYEFSSDTYEGADLALMASHLLFGRTVVSWAYQKVPFQCVWIVLDSGALLGLTYLPEQEVVGWHRHDTDGFFESVCCVSEGNEDAVYTVVRREVGGVQKRYIERFASRFFTTIEDAFFVDCGLTYDGRLAGAGISFTLSGGESWSYEETFTFTTAVDFFVGASDLGDEIVVYDAAGVALRLTIMEYVSTKSVKVLADRTVPGEYRNVERIGFQVARNTFTGLDHLEGKMVSILADGNVEDPMLVVDGSFQLGNPAVVVNAGLSIEADFETLDLNIQGQSLQDKVKNVRSVTLLVEKTRGLSAGPDPDHLLELAPSPSWEYDKPTAEVTGFIKTNIISDWSDGGRVFVRQSDPLPATILSALPEVALGGA